MRKITRFYATVNCESSEHRIFPCEEARLAYLNPLAWPMRSSPEQSAYARLNPGPAVAVFAAALSLAQPERSSAVNLLDPLPVDRNAEVLTELLRHGPVRIERIVSNGHASPEGFWYDQDEHEWVLLLEGEAGIEWADGQRIHLRRGDALNLPAHTRHRVQFTSCPAVWLAVFYGDGSGAAGVHPLPD